MLSILLSCILGWFSLHVIIAFFKVKEEMQNEKSNDDFEINKWLTNELKD
jgi:hypothetical protein